MQCQPATWKRIASSARRWSSFDRSCPREEVNHFGDDRQGKIAGRRQLQAAGLRRVMQQNKSVVRDGGRVEFVGGQIIREAESRVRRRRLSMERVEALVGQRGPRGFDAAQANDEHGRCLEIPALSCSPHGRQD